MNRVTDEMIDEAMRAELGAMPRTVGASDAQLKAMADSQPARFSRIEFYAIKDTARSAYMDPRFYQNDAVAFRELEAELDSNQSRYSHALADFELWHLGSWDIGDGMIVPVEPRMVIALRTFKE